MANIDINTQVYLLAQAALCLLRYGEGIVLQDTEGELFIAYKSEDEENDQQDLLMLARVADFGGPTLEDEDLRAQLQPGMIIIMHDSAEEAQAAHDAENANAEPAMARGFHPLALDPKKLH